MQQAFAVKKPEAAARLLLSQAFFFHCSVQSIGNSYGRRTCAEDNDLLVPQSLLSHLDRAQNRAECNSGRSLDIVVKGQQLIAITLEDRPGMRIREIFPLQACFRRLLFHRLHESLDEVVVVLASDSLATPAEVIRVVEPFLIIRSYVEHDRQRSLRANAAYERVKRKLTDWDAQSACSLITDA